MENEPTLSDWLGGMPALLQMTNRFYGYYVVNDPLLEPVLTGIPEHGATHYAFRQHLNRSQTRQRRARWVNLMGLAAEDAGVPTDPEFR